MSWTVTSPFAVIFIFPSAELAFKSTTLALSSITSPCEVDDIKVMLFPPARIFKSLNSPDAESVRLLDAVKNISASLKY